MPSYTARRSERVKGAAGAGVAAMLIGWAVFEGLAAPTWHRRADEPPPTFALAPEPPRPKLAQTVRTSHDHREAAAAAPAGRRATPTDLVAPPPLLAVPPPLIVTAPSPDAGDAPSMGAAALGSGRGAGGAGDGRGAGGYGDGDGGGGASPPRHRSGSLRDSDFPREAIDAGANGTVAVRYLVNVDGRVSDCGVTQSSGSPSLDNTTCRLIEKRFRFDPSRDADGRPVRAIIVERHSWLMERPPSLPPE